jgi:hypothetical protein
MPTPYVDPNMYTRLAQNQQRQPGQITQSKGSGVMDFLNSPLGGATISAGAGLLQGAQQNAQSNKQMAQNSNQFRADILQRQHESDINDQRSRSTSAAELDPLGASQMFAAKNALISKVLGGAQNIHYTPGDAGIASAMGSVSMPSVPHFSADELNKYFGDNTTQASIAQRQKSIGQVDPNHPAFDLSTMFGNSPDGSPNSFMTDIQSSNHQALQHQMDASAQSRNDIMQALQADQQSQQQQKPEHHGNIFGKILKGVGIGASFIPGVGQIVAPIATGLGGLVNGDGLKSSLINAGISAIPMGGGAAKVGSTAVKQGIKQGVKQAVKTPALYAALANGMR